MASFRITSLPLNGTLYSDAALRTSIVLDGTVAACGNAATVYFCRNNFSGAASFKYAAIDNNGAEDASPATASITVGAVNDAPETNAGSGSGPKAQPRLRSRCRARTSRARWRRSASPACR